MRLYRQKSLINFHHFYLIFYFLTYQWTFLTPIQLLKLATCNTSHPLWRLKTICISNCCLSLIRTCLFVVKRVYLELLSSRLENKNWQLFRNLIHWNTLLISLWAHHLSIARVDDVYKFSLSDIQAIIIIINNSQISSGVCLLIIMYLSSTLRTCAQCRRRRRCCHRRRVCCVADVLLPSVSC